MAHQPDERPNLASPSAEARAALLQRWAQGDFTVTRPRGGGEVAHTRGTHLTFDQEGHWRHSQGAPTDPGRNQYVILRLIGDLDRGRLRQAIRELIGRHEIFRSFYTATKAGPEMRVIDDFSVDILEIQLNGHDDDELSAEVRTICDDFAATPFDLSAAPLFRVVIFRATNTLNWLLFQVDHIIFDGWSLGIVFHEIQQNYNGVPLEPPAPPFHRYASLLRARTPSAPPSAVHSALTEMFRAPDPIPCLPTDMPRQPGLAARPVRLHFEMSAQSARAVQQAVRRFGATPHSLLTACFSMLIAAQSNKHGVMFYTVTANRSVAEFQNTIGLFRALLLLRIDVNARAGFSDHLAGVRQGLREAAGLNGLYPATLQVDEAIKLFGADLGEAFKIGLVVQNYPKHALNFRDLTTSIDDIYYGGGGQDISLIFSDVDALSGYVRYNSALFMEPTVHALLSRMDDLLVAALSPDPPPMSELMQLCAASIST